MTSADSSSPPEGFAGALGRELGVREVRTGAWFTKLVTLYLRFHPAREASARELALPPTARAARVIQRAALKSSLTGAAAAATATGAAVLTVQTQGLGAIAGVPAAALGIFGELLYRALVHVELTVDLAQIYGFELDARDPTELMRVYALAFGLEGARDGKLAEAQNALDGVLRLSGHDMGLRIGGRLVGDSLKRNAVPFMGIVTSAISSYRRTRDLGVTVHRYVRLHQALREALVAHIARLGDEAPLLVEGAWFMLTADGRLAAAETAALAWLIEQFPADARAGLTARFVEDEAEFHARLARTPEHVRDTLLQAFEVAAAVEGPPTLPERRVLRNAARALGREVDAARLGRVARELGQ
ncbi:MAG: hypothetical protein IT374_18255 [Polyangiaceae bacterium]|nr:hypothetical protein [Polyangiaceae bacterium]